jgi:holo-[acyl-carrier protein] synthase
LQPAGTLIPKCWQLQLLDPIRSLFEITKFTMPEIVTGIDLIEIERFKSAIDRHGDRLLNKVFTPRELSDVGGKPASLAARFAAKEAVAKSLGTGIGPIGWQEIEILRADTGQPTLQLAGAAEQLALQHGLSNWSISLSHSQTHAVAVAVAIGEC